MERSKRWLPVATSFAGAVVVGVAIMLLAFPYVSRGPSSNDDEMNGLQTRTTAATPGTKSPQMVLTRSKR